MENYTSLLVVVNPQSDEQPALSRALEIARSNQADIKLFLAIYDFSYEMTTMLSSDEREAMRKGVVAQQQQWIESLLASLGDTGSSISVKVVWHNRPYEAIIKEAIEAQHDLIIKSTHAHDKLKSVIFTPTDWHLIRKAPMPVLLVKEHDWPENGAIIAAINAGTEDEDHISLNRAITATALNMAEQLQSHVHIVNAYPGTPVNIAIEIPDFDPQSYNEAVKEHHEKETLTHAQQYGITPDMCHVAEGLAEDVIPELAEQLDAELVILGSVGRTGISAALIGNTAEHIIDSLNCDVLALKPAGFVSPVKAD